MIPPPDHSSWLPALGAVALISVIPLAALLALGTARSIDRAIPGLLALAAGALLGNALLELMPESIARLGNGPRVPLLVLTGFIGFFVFERFLTTHDHLATRSLRPFVLLNFVGITAHNVIDGMVVAASFIASIPLGVSTALAVFLHEIPHEFGNFGVFVQGGVSLRNAALVNFASALAAFAGALAVLLLGARASVFAEGLLPFAAGAFLYVAAADLIPELHRAPRRATALVQLACMLLGVLIVLAPQILGDQHR